MKLGLSSVLLALFLSAAVIARPCDTGACDTNEGYGPEDPAYQGGLPTNFPSALPNGCGEGYGQDSDCNTPLITPTPGCETGDDPNCPEGGFPDGYGAQPGGFSGGGYGPPGGVPGGYGPPGGVPGGYGPPGGVPGGYGPPGGFPGAGCQTGDDPNCPHGGFPGGYGPPAVDCDLQDPHIQSHVDGQLLTYSKSCSQARDFIQKECKRGYNANTFAIGNKFNSICQEGNNILIVYKKFQSIKASQASFRTEYGHVPGNCKNVPSSIVSIIADFSRMMKAIYLLGDKRLIFECKKHYGLIQVIILQVQHILVALLLDVKLILVNVDVYVFHVLNITVGVVNTILGGLGGGLLRGGLLGGGLI